MTLSIEPYRLTATEIIALISTGKLTVEEYARSLLSRVRERDSAVHAWAYLDEELIITSARALDEVPKANRGPLHGVAVGVKDVIYTKDMPTQYNSPIYVGHHPEVDAQCILTLRAAGALIFGKTHTAEFAATQKGGPCRNPHDPTRTPGGTSSGSGAAVADFHVPIALGTQTFGSTIRPGSFNGICAFKPTWGAISRDGVKIYSIMLDTLGFYTRSLDDLSLLAEVFQLEDDEPLPAAPFTLKGAKIAVCKTHVWSEASKSLEAVMQRAVALLREEGAHVDELDLPDFEKIASWREIIMDCEGKTSFIGEYATAKGQLGQQLVELVEDKSRWTRAQQLQAYDGMAILRAKFDQIAKGYAGVLTPSATGEAPVGLGFTGSASFCGMWSMLHTPVINLPGFAGENGLPIGLSLVAPRYFDRHLLHVATPIARLFTERGGWSSSL